MKIAIYMLLLAALGATQSACNVSEALDSTIDMNGKMDQMLEKLETTNENMQGMDGTVGKTNEGMDGMSAKLDEMLDAMHELLALGEMAEDLEVALAFEAAVRKDFNHPSQAAVGGQKFTEAATAEQILDVTYVYVRTLNGVPGDVGHSNHQLTDQERQSLLYSMMGIGYTIPQEKLEEIMETHIEENSNRAEIALMLLAFRAQMLNLLISSDLLGPYISEVYSGQEISQRQKLTSLARLSDAITSFKDFNSLFELSYKDEIYHEFAPSPFRLTEIDESIRGEQVKALKHAVENWLDCSEVSESQGLNALTDMIADLQPYFEMYSVPLPVKECPL